MPLSESQIANMKERRQKVLEQAIIMFSEQGYNDTTISKVAKAAGVSFGSVFTYFSTKEELFYHAITEPLEEVSKEILDFSPDADEPLSEIRNMVKRHIQIFASMDTYIRLVAQVIGQYQRFPEPFVELDTFHNILREKIGLLVQKGQEIGQLEKLHPKSLATAYTSFLMGLRLNLTDAPEDNIWEDFVPFAIRLFGPKNV